MSTENDMGDYWTRNIQNGLDGGETVLVNESADSVSTSVDLDNDSLSTESDALPFAGDPELPSEAHFNNDSQTVYGVQFESHFPRSLDVGLFFGAQEEYDLDFTALSPSIRSASEDDSCQSLVGHWIGTYTYMTGVTGETEGLIAFDVTVYNDDGTFSGEGVDLIGRYVVKGELKDLRIVFIKTYTLQWSGSDTVWQYQCLFDRDQEEMRGTWGYPTNKEDIQSYLAGNDFAWSLGTFVFKRRPVEYFLFRSEADFAANRFRALWTWAIRSVLRKVQSKHLQWKVIRDHRDRRRRYLELTEQRNSEAEAIEWAGLLQTITPETLRFWDSLHRFRERRTIAHGAHCDGCGGGLTASRLTCVQCSRGEISQTVDLCAQCMGRSVFRASDKKKHTPGHHLLQIRNLVHRRHVLAALSAGEVALQYADALLDYVKDRNMPFGDPTCKVCDRTVTRPAWYCIDCECKPPEYSRNIQLTNLLDGVFICYDCNARTMVEQPWLFERRAHSDPSIHSWAHTLMLMPLPGDSGVSQAETPSIDERLVQLSTGVEVNTIEIGRLHARLDTMSMHMERLEALLNRLVDSE